MIVGFGATVLDVVVHTQNEILLRDKNPITQQIFQIGGVIPTVLMLLARLGLPCKLYSAVGQDIFGGFLLDKLIKEQIDVSSVIKTEDVATPVSVAVVEPTGGERTGFTARGFFSKLRGDLLCMILPKEANMVVVDGHNPSCAVQILDQAKKRNVLSIMDLGTYKPGMEPLLSLVDVAVAPHVYTQKAWSGSTLEESLSKIRSFGPHTAVITMGKEGSIVSHKDEEVFHQPAYPVTAIDTNGAGDIFLGALSYGLYSQWEVKSSVQFASAVAALSCEHTGKDEKLLRSVVNSALEGNIGHEQKQILDEALPILPDSFKTLIG